MPSEEVLYSPLRTLLHDAPTMCELRRHQTDRGQDGRGPLCEPCYDRDPASHRTCTKCGASERLHGNGLCVGCTRDRRLRDLLGDPNDATRPEVGKLRAALLADNPLSVLNWLRRSPASGEVLTDLASRPCTFSHEAMEKRLPGKVGAHFRAILVAAQALPPRDEHLATVQHWVDTILTTVRSESDQRLIRTYVTWHHLAAIRPPRPREACDGKPDLMDPNLRARGSGALKLGVRIGHHTGLLHSAPAGRIPHQRSSRPVHGAPLPALGKRPEDTPARTSPSPSSPPSNTLLRRLTTSAGRRPGASFSTTRSPSTAVSPACSSFSTPNRLPKLRG